LPKSSTRGKFIDNLKIELDENPEMGDLISGGEGLRKVRMVLPGRGKRGGSRVIYYGVVDECVLLVDLYAKNQKADLQPNELKDDVLIRDFMLKVFKEHYYGKDPR